MNEKINLHHIQDYLSICKLQRNLSSKTIKAYGIDLKQFAFFLKKIECNKESINNYIEHLHTHYNKPKTIKRKIATLKAFFSYLEFNELIEENPFSKIRVSFKEPQLLPKTIEISYMRKIFSKVYQDIMNSKTTNDEQKSVRNAAVVELLFSTGIRISELCNIQESNLNLYSGTLRILGKGQKERLLQIGNTNVLKILKKYQYISKNTHDTEYFFVNNSGRRLTEQAVRILLMSYEKELEIPIHITPHMIRHTFATQLLEGDVDIRYIQRILGHSSITTTQIYTHVSSLKQKEILISKNPRNLIDINL